jgi:hypothetical protein
MILSDKIISRKESLNNYEKNYLLHNKKHLILDSIELSLKDVIL